MTGAETAAAAFAVAGSIVSVESHPTGHINDAWLVTRLREEKGVLIVPEAGKYTFYLDSDDGSRLTLDGASQS